jgi:ParB family chromosome partitioning protein
MRCSRDEIIGISSIDLADNTFKITTGETIEDLARSITNTGLINSPVVIKKDSGFLIISGFRRIRAAASLGWTEIPSGIAAPDTDRFLCARLAITDNSLQRPLNLIEMSRCYKLLSFFCEKKDLPAEAVKLGLPENPSFIEKVIRLCGFPFELQQYIISGSLSLAMALELVKPEYDGCEIMFARIFNDLKLSLNKQRELLALSYEIAVREGIKVSDVVGNPEFQNIISDKNTDRNLKANNIRKYIKSKRYPSIVKAQDDFKKNLKELALPTGIKLIPPADFEGNTFSVNMEFKSMREFKEHAECLGRLKKNPVLEKIVSKNP